MQSFSDPAVYKKAIVADALQTQTPNGIYVETTGVINCILSGELDDDANYHAIPVVAGVPHPLRLKKFKSSGSTCGNVFGMFSINPR